MKLLCNQCVLLKLLPLLDGYATLNLQWQNGQGIHSVLSVISARGLTVILCNIIVNNLEKCVWEEDYFRVYPLKLKGAEGDLLCVQNNSKIISIHGLIPCIKETLQFQCQYLINSILSKKN